MSLPGCWNSSNVVSLFMINHTPVANTSPVSIQLSVNFWHSDVPLHVPTRKNQVCCRDSQRAVRENLW